MTRRHYTNLATQQTLNAAITSSDATLTINDSFSGWPTEYPFDATIALGESDVEIVSVTGISSRVATIDRAQGGTSAASHLAGATFDLTATAQDYDEANAHVNSDSGVHGVTGDVVGTTDTQTLTNKTLTSPTISGPTVTGTLAAAAITASGDAAVTGDATVGGTLGVTGAITASDDVTVGGNLTASGDIALMGDLTGDWADHRPAIAAGFVSITPSALNTLTDATITFPAGLFASTPTVVVSLIAHAQTVNYRVSSSSATATSVLVSLLQTGGTVAATSVSWVAIGEQIT